MALHRFTVSSRYFSSNHVYKISSVLKNLVIFSKTIDAPQKKFNFLLRSTFGREKKRRRKRRRKKRKMKEREREKEDDEEGEK